MNFLKSMTHKVVDKVEGTIDSTIEGMAKDLKETVGKGVTGTTEGVADKKDGGDADSWDLTEENLREKMEQIEQEYNHLNQKMKALLKHLEEKKMADQ